MRHGQYGRLFAVALLLQAGCRDDDEAPPIPRSELSATDLDDARAALLLHLHAEGLREAPDAVGGSCIVAEDLSEPSPRLLRLLSGNGLGIKNRSRCVSRGRRTVDAISGLPAMVLSVHSIAITEPGKGTAIGTYGLGGLWCGGGEYALTFAFGKWEASPVGPRLMC